MVVVRSREVGLILNLCGCRTERFGRGEDWMLEIYANRTRKGKDGWRKESESIKIKERGKPNNRTQTGGSIPFSPRARAGG